MMFRKTMIGAMHVLVLGALLVPIAQAAVPAEEGQQTQAQQPQTAYPRPDDRAGVRGIGNQALQTLPSSPTVNTFTIAAREHGAAGYGNVQMEQLSQRPTVNTFTIAAREHGAAGYGNVQMGNAAPQTFPRPDDRAGVLGIGTVADTSASQPSSSSDFDWTTLLLAVGGSLTLVLLIGAGAATVTRSHSGRVATR